MRRSSAQRKGRIVVLSPQCYCGQEVIGDNRHLHKALVQLVRPGSGSGEKLGQAQDIEQEKKTYDKSCKKTEFKTPVIRYISVNI